MDKLDKKIESKINQNKKVPLKFTQTIQGALYKETKTKNKIFEFAKICATACAGILIAGGVSFAGHELYQKIWKDPERISVEEAQKESIEEKQYITEEQAKEIAKNKLKELGFLNEEITETIDVPSQEKMLDLYCFKTNNKWIISINAITSEFESLSFGDYNNEWEKYTITRKEAIEVAKDFYNKFGYKEGEYKLVSLRANDKKGEGNGNSGYEFYAQFSKVYDGLANRYETIEIDFLAKDKQLYNYSVLNNKFENNPLEITKEQAIEIAKNEDRKVETKDIIKTDAELRIEKMNGNAYARLKYTDDYYKPMMQTDVPDNERYLYKTDNRVRRVWVVVFNYAEKNDENKSEFENLAERTQKGQYSYFVDCTTGEIIGGDSSDYLRWDNQWAKYYAVE